MNMNELSSELKEQLKNCKTREEAEACLKVNHVDLSLDEMEKVSGGYWLFPECWPWAHEWEKTGRTQQAVKRNAVMDHDLFVTKHEYKCRICGSTEWR